MARKRVLNEEVLSAPTDDAQFGMRVRVKVVPAESEEAVDEDEVAEDTAELADFMERLRFVRGELHHDADYIRGRRERNVKEESRPACAAQQYVI